MIGDIEPKYRKDLRQLFLGEWWSKNRTPEDVDRILENSSIALGLVNNETDVLLGFVRVLTDYCYFGFVFDLIVAPQERGKGLGSRLLTAIIDYPKLQAVQSLELCCQPDKAEFYNRHGFTEAGGRMRLVRAGADF